MLLNSDHKPLPLPFPLPQLPHVNGTHPFSSSSSIGDKKVRQLNFDGNRKEFDFAYLVSQMCGHSASFKRKRMEIRSRYYCFSFERREKTTEDQIDFFRSLEKDETGNGNLPCGVSREPPLID